MNGTLSFDADPRDGHIRVSGSGMWTADYAETHFRGLERTVLRVRKLRGSVRVLVDLRDAAVQTGETAAVVREWTGRIYREADRVAIVCATALLALQMKHAADISTLATFHEIESALAWIGAAEPALSARRHA